MTIQSNLGLVWASTGGVTDPGDTKYNLGWVAEIPNFQNMNFVQQNFSKNLLVLAESGYYTWQDDITYAPGAKVVDGGIRYTCILASTNNQPSLDTVHTYWVYGDIYGNKAASNLAVTAGLCVSDVNPRVTATTWDGSDISVQNSSALLQLNTSGATDNWLLGNVSGSLVAVALSAQTVPDGRSIALADPAVHKLYHEGNKPVQADVAGTIPDAPSDTKLYGRKDAAWSEVSLDAVPEAPNDGKQYGRESLGWTEVVSGISDAPSDGNTYGRKDAAWEEVTSNDDSGQHWLLLSSNSIPETSELVVSFGTYSKIRVVIEGAIPYSDTQMKVQFKQGATLLNGGKYVKQGTTTPITTSIPVNTGSWSNDATYGYGDVVMDFVGCNVTHIHPILKTTAIFTSNVNNQSRCDVGSYTYYNNADVATDSARIFWQSNNFRATGTIKVYGMVEA